VRARWAARAALAVLALVLSLAPAPPVHAREASVEQVRSLAQRAAGDAGALEALRDVDRVGGRPVDLARALAADSPQVLRARLEALAAAGAVTPEAPSAAMARERAAAELAGREYDASSLPQPLRSPLEQLADLLEDAFAWLVDVLPGGRVSGWSLIAAVVLVVALLLAQRTVRRAARAEQGAQAAALRSRGGDPRELLRAAEEAEARGDLGVALRLRFRAGVADLAARDLVPARASAGVAELERRLRSPTFSGLARRFEEIAYGGRSAHAGDLEAAREGWPRVPREARGEGRR